MKNGPTYLFKGKQISQEKYQQLTMRFMIAIGEAITSTRYSEEMGMIIELKNPIGGDSGLSDEARNKIYLGDFEC